MLLLLNSYLVENLVSLLKINKKQLQNEIDKTNKKNR